MTSTRKVYVKGLATKLRKVASYQNCSRSIATLSNYAAKI